MAQNTLEVFKEIQITHKGTKPDLKIDLVKKKTEDWHQLLLTKGVSLMTTV